MGSHDRIRDAHREIIDGMNEWYETLIKMQYINADEVRGPPHDVSSLPALQTDEVLAPGFAPDAAALIRQLPHLVEYKSHDEQPAIGPATFPVPYMSRRLDLRTGNLRSVTEVPLVDLGADEQAAAAIPASAVKLATYKRPPPGKALHYDTADQTISTWPCGEDFNDYYQNYNNRVSRPASQAVHEWLENLRTLRWVPQIVPGDMRNVEEWDDDRYEKDIAQHSASEQTRQSGEQVHVFGTSLRSGLPDNHASVPYPERRAAERNRDFAWRNMYKEAGWPERYDREAFEAKRKQYLEELAEVTDVYTRGPRAACYWDLETGKLLREFYKRLAGADAV